MQTMWDAVDGYFERHLLGGDDALAAALSASDAAGLPPHAVAANQGALLNILARTVGARRILEIGTLGGYSTIWLARALPEGGEVVSLEADAAHARVARANLARAGLGACAQVIVGPALESLPGLEPPFDFAFIDADKRNNPAYFTHALRLVRAGGLIVVDNVVRGGEVADAASRDASVIGVRALVDQLAQEPRVVATAIQTVGAKGYDGFILAWVR